MVHSYLSHVTSVTLPHLSGICFECTFDPELYSRYSAEQLGVVLPEALKNAVTKRKAEFIAGRYVAKKCLDKMGAVNSTVEIGPQRAPLWPVGMTGSISHSDNRAICFVEPSRHPEQGVGIDIEGYLPKETAASVKGSIINEAESVLIAKHYKEFAKGLTVVFSAKEGLFKALYPQVKVYFDFLDAEVTALDEDTLTLTLKKQLTPRLVEGCAFTVYVQHQRTMVLTYTHS